MKKLLTPFLTSSQRPEGTLTYHEVQGFLFAIVSAPELVKPSEWLPLIFNEQDAQYDSMEGAQSVTQALMDLYNVINTQVLEGEVALPDTIQFDSPSLENVGETATLGQWSHGFFLGHNWLVKSWDHYTPESLSEELGSCLMVLSFFSNPKLAGAYYQEIAKPTERSLESFAETLLGMFEGAMNSYAHLGRSIQLALADEAQQPHMREQRVGRNDPCPCGSGRKYKKCCLQ